MARRVDHVKKMVEGQVGKVPVVLTKALNDFFNKHPELAEGCLIRFNWDYGAKVALIFESSDLYHHLQGEYGWDIHTEFHNAFDGTGYYFELINSCTAGFYPI